MTVSATDIFEGDSHTTTASLLTNLNGDSLVDRVDWTVEADSDDDPEHEWPDDDPGVSSDFTFTYDGLGSTTGSAVVVKAVAADANGNTNTDQATINVWTKSETVAIVSQTNDQTYVGAIMANISVQTDVGFYRVDWSIDGGTPISDNGPGMTSQITYDFSTVPYGNTVAFTATPYGVNANGEAVAGNAATINIRVVEPISSVTMGWLQPNAVVGEQIHLRATSDAPYHTMEWYLGDSKTPIASAASRYVGDRHAYATYTFEAGQGSNADSGREHVIKAVAYAIEPKEGNTPIQWANAPVEPIISGARVESVGSSIFVHEGKEKIHNSVYVYINGIDIGDDRSCSVSWWHEVSYYNEVPGAELRVYDNDGDGAHAKLYAWAKMFEWDEEGNRAYSWVFMAGDKHGKEGGNDLDFHLYLGLDVKYSANANATFTETVGDWLDLDGDGKLEHFEPKRMIKNYEYRFLANTDLVVVSDQVGDGVDEINWTDTGTLKLMHRSDRRKYIGDIEDAAEPVDPGTVWTDGSNSVGGSTGVFDEW